MSRPRAATSVATSRCCWPDLKESRTFIRVNCRHSKARHSTGAAKITVFSNELRNMPSAATSAATGKCCHPDLNESSDRPLRLLQPPHPGHDTVPCCAVLCTALLHGAHSHLIHVTMDGHRPESCIVQCLGHPNSLCIATSRAHCCWPGMSSTTLQAPPQHPRH